MASRAHINISVYFIVSINAMPFDILCVLKSKKLKG